MFRLWAKIFKDNRMLKDMVVCNEKEDMTRTQKFLQPSMKFAMHMIYRNQSG